MAVVGAEVGALDGVGLDCVAAGCGVLVDRAVWWVPGAAVGLESSRLAVGASVALATGCCEVPRGVGAGMAAVGREAVGVAEFGSVSPQATRTAVARKRLQASVVGQSNLSAKIRIINCYTYLQINLDSVQRAHFGLMSNVEPARSASSAALRPQRILLSFRYLHGWSHGLGGRSRV